MHIMCTKSLRIIYKCNTSSNIDTVSDSLERVNISNDYDDELFQDPPPKEDCQICFLPMPYTNGLCGVEVVYQPCCGKSMCGGCTSAENKEMKEGNIKEWCPFCRLPYPKSDEERVKRIKS